MSFDTDWLFPTREVARVAAAIPQAKHLDIATPNGHDAFLVEQEKMIAPLKRFLDNAE